MPISPFGPREGQRTPTRQPRPCTTGTRRQAKPTPPKLAPSSPHVPPTERKGKAHPAHQHSPHPRRYCSRGPCGSRMIIRKLTKQIMFASTRPARARQIITSSPGRLTSVENAAEPSNCADVSSMSIKIWAVHIRPGVD